jgi:hypothetical protein
LIEQSTLRAILPDGFVSNPFEPVTSFIKCVPRGVRCTLPFRPAKAVPYLSRKYGQQPKEVTKKDRSRLKFLTAQKGLF